MGTFPYLHRYAGSAADWRGAGVANLRPCGRIYGVGQCPCNGLEATLVRDDGETTTARHMRRESITTAAPAR